MLATDWATISSVITGAGTLVLALATFASVRSSNRSARIAEAALQEQRRPVLVPSRFDDPVQKIMFVEGHWAAAAGGRGTAEALDGAVLLTMSLRNVGSGIGVCQGWTLRPGQGSPRTHPTHAPLEDFRLQTRDLYVPAGDIGMWQGALRDPDDPIRAQLAETIDSGEPIALELLYTDQIGQQRTITRFGLMASPSGDSRIVSVTRHWYLDSDGPRPDSTVIAAAEVVQREREAAEQRAEQDLAAALKDGDERDRDGDAPERREGAGAPDGALPADRAKAQGAPQPTVRSGAADERG